MNSLLHYELLECLLQCSPNIIMTAKRGAAPIKNVLITLLPSTKI